jgi:hypothetical protein
MREIAAHIAGVVSARFADPGEMVAAGAPVVTITAEGHEGKSFRGTMEELPDVVLPRQMKPQDPSRPVDTRVLLVKIRLDESVPLKLGQRVEVEIGG